MRIFIGESDRWGHKPLYAALLELFRSRGLAGATIVKGVAGFGPDSAAILRLSSDLPLRDRCGGLAEHLDTVLPEVERMMSGGLITM